MQEGSQCGRFCWPVRPCSERHRPVGRRRSRSLHRRCSRPSPGRNLCKARSRRLGSPARAITTRTTRWRRSRPTPATSSGLGAGDSGASAGHRGHPLTWPRRVRRPGRVLDRQQPSRPAPSLPDRPVAGGATVLPGAKLNPIGMASYMRLYPGVDGMATNGLRYGAQIRSCGKTSPPRVQDPYPSQNGALSPGGSASPGKRCSSTGRICTFRLTTSA